MRKGKMNESEKENIGRLKELLILYFVRSFVLLIECYMRGDRTYLVL